MAAQSLLFPSAPLPIAPKTLTLTLAIPFSSSLSFNHSPFKLLSLSASLPSRKAGRFGSGIVSNVALSSDVEEEEEELGGGRQPHFSPDLKIFVGNLPFNVDSAELADLFERAGTVEMVEVIYDKLTGRSRGFGFVTMSTVEEVESAVQQLNGYELSGRSLRVNSGPPPPPGDRPPTRGPRFGSGSNTDASSRVYVGNLPWSADNMALETLFSEQGKVLEAKVVYDRESGRSRGFGFVTYGCAAEANNAISSLDGMDLDGRQIRVTVAEARPRRPF